MDKVYSLYVKDQLSVEGFGKRYKPLEERLGQINDEIPVIQGEIDFLKIKYLSSDEILHEERDLYSRWNKLNKKEKMEIIQTITDTIIIGKGNVTINLNYLPPFLGTDGNFSPNKRRFLVVISVNRAGS